MTAAERESEDFANALPGFESQTHVRPENARFYVVAVGGFTFFIARPLVRRRRGTVETIDFDTWWVWDDLSEDNGWIGQATLTEDGLIERPGALRARLDALAMDDDDEVDESSSDRDPHAPVTVSLDLEEHEAAKREGIGAWEEHNEYSVLVTDNGFAVVQPPGAGIVRYHDKTACTFLANGTNAAKTQAEKYLANRPYKNAYERVLGEPEFGEESTQRTSPPSNGPPTEPTPRPKPEKRVWKTVPITSADEDDD
jgi:hypothetical protein